MGEGGEVFVGIDVAKMRNAVAIADGGRGGEVRYVGEVEASDESMRRLVKRIAAKHGRAHFCYEAWPTGYHLYRLITALGKPCTVVAPSLIPRKPGERVKTNRRDAVDHKDSVPALPSPSPQSERLRGELPRIAGKEVGVHTLAGWGESRSRFTRLPDFWLSRWTSPAGLAAIAVTRSELLNTDAYLRFVAPCTSAANF